MADGSTELGLDVAKIRGDFPILSRTIHDKPLTYLDNAASAQRPRQVLATLIDVYEHRYANVHRGIHWLSEQSTDLFEQSRETVQRFINAAHQVNRVKAFFALVLDALFLTAGKRNREINIYFSAI